MTGKNLLVLRARRVRLAVRNPHGGTLTVTPRRPSGRIVAATGDHVSFTGTRVGRVVVARTVAVVHTR